MSPCPVNQTCSGLFSSLIQSALPVNPSIFFFLSLSLCLSESLFHLLSLLLPLCFSCSFSIYPIFLSLLLTLDFHAVSMHLCLPSLSSRSLSLSSPLSIIFLNLFFLCLSVSFSFYAWTLLYITFIIAYCPHMYCQKRMILCNVSFCHNPYH